MERQTRLLPVVSGFSRTDEFVDFINAARTS